MTEGRTGSLSWSRSRSRESCTSWARSGPALLKGPSSSLRLCPSPLSLGGVWPEYYSALFLYMPPT